MSVPAIRDALLASLPPVSYDPSAPLMLRESIAPATVLAEAEQLIADIWHEQDPHHADVTLGDWERVLGLPDCCTTTAQTVEQRRDAVVEKWLMRGRLDRAYFIALAARRGVVITIDELGNHKWRVNAPMAGYREFLAGTAVAGDHLREWGDEPMECRITRLKPAHTLAVFGYAVTPGAESNFDFTANQVSSLVTSTGGLKRTFVDKNGVRRDSVTAARLDHDPKGRTNNLKFARNMANATNWLQNTGGWWTSQDSTDVPQPILPGGQVVRVTKFTKVAATPPDSVFSRCHNLSISAGSRSGSVYIYVPPGQGINSFQIKCDWQDIEQGSTASSAVFGAWVRLNSTATTVAARTFLDYNLSVNGTNTTPPLGLVFYTAAPQESNGLSDFIATDESPVTVFDCRGLLNEPDTAQQVRNNKMNGVVPGIPGTTPLYWSTTSSTGTFTRTVVGSGVEDGIPYVEVRLQFTGASANAAAFAFESSTQIAALAGDKWNTSVYCRIVAGSLANLDAIIYINELNVVGGYVTNGTSSILSMTTAPLREQRFSMSRTVVDGLTRYILPGVYFYNAAGAADITIRIGLPQAEKRDFATFPVSSDGALETGTAASHLVAGASFASYYNPTEGTFSIDWTPFAITHNEVYWGIGQSAFFNNSFYLVNSFGSLFLIVYSAGVNTVSLNLGALVAGVRQKVAISYKAGEIAARRNGGAEALAGGAMPTTVNTESLLCSPWGGGSGGVAAHLRQRKYWPRARRADLASLSTY